MIFNKLNDSLLCESPMCSTPSLMKGTLPPTSTLKANVEHQLLGRNGQYGCTVITPISSGGLKCPLGSAI